MDVEFFLLASGNQNCVVSCSRDFGFVSIDGDSRQRRLPWQAQLELDLRRFSGRGKKDFASDVSRGLVRSKFETDASPAGWRVFHANWFSGCEPGTWDTLRKIKNLLVGIFENQHPTDQQWNRLLRGYAEQSSASVDARNFSRGPATAGVVGVMVRVEEQQILFHAVKPQQHLRVTIRDETQDGPVARTGPADVGNHTKGRCSVRAHAIDHQVGQIGWENVGLKQLGVRTMRPLLRTGALFCEGIAESH